MFFKFRPWAARVACVSHEFSTLWRSASILLLALSCGGLLHVEGVAVGLGLAFKLSARLGLCPSADADRVVSHLAASGLPAELAMLNRRFSAASLIEHMRREKKMRDGALHFVLARGLGW